MTTTTFNRHLPPDTFGADVIAAIEDHLAYTDNHATAPPAGELLGIQVNGRSLGEWIAIGFAAVDMRIAQLDALTVADRAFPRTLGNELVTAARDWHNDRARLLITLIGDIPA